MGWRRLDSRSQWKAMEFAITGPGKLPALMTPGCRAAPGVFCWRQRGGRTESILANLADRDVWSRGHAGALRIAGPGPVAGRQHISLWNIDRQSDWMLFSGADRAIHAESPGDFAGLACGDCGGILWRLHDVFEFWLGDGENAGRRRVDAGGDLCKRERGGGASVVGGGHSVGESVLAFHGVRR